MSQLLRPHGLKPWNTTQSWNSEVFLFAATRTDFQDMRLSKISRWTRKNTVLYHLTCWSLSSILHFVTPWTIDHQGPLSTGFSRQQYWSGLMFPSPVIWLTVESKKTKQTIVYNKIGETHRYREKAMTTHSSTLAWKIPWTNQPGRLQSMRSWRVRHDWATSLSHFTVMHWRRKWHPTPVFLPGESQGQGSLAGCRLWGCTESDTTEAT